MSETIVHKMYPLIELTQIGSPDFAQGLPTLCLIEPQSIMHVRRGNGSYMKQPAMDAEGWVDDTVHRWHKRRECSIIMQHNGQQMMVTETVARVQWLRNQALGITQADFIEPDPPY